MIPAVMSDLRDIHHAETRAAARDAMAIFAEKCATKSGDREMPVVTPYRYNGAWDQAAMA
ncbi:hypothetical protein AA16663_2598 [Komagataeibacter rhaeticus DSM 16663]|nr:hypothetical protein AA16663_2598 [Komagataeibacter rhaeticus DSM 16663]